MIREGARKNPMVTSIIAVAGTVPAKASAIVPTDISEHRTTKRFLKVERQLRLP